MLRLSLLCGAAFGFLATPDARAEAAEPRGASTQTLDAFLAPAPGGLTSAQAAQRARDTSYDAAQRRQALAAAEARLDEAMVAYYPKLQLLGSYTRYSPLTLVVPLGQNPTPIPVALDAYLFQAGLTIPISDYVLRLSQNYASASRSKRATALDERASRLNAALEGRNTYYTWVRARAQLFVSERALEQAAAHLEDARHAFEVGTSSKADVLQVEAQVASNELLVAQAKNAAGLAAAQLKTIMHDLSTQPYAFGEDIRVDLPATRGLDNMAALQSEALEHRLEIRALDETAWSLREQAKATRASYFPRLDGFGDAIYANPNPRYFFPDGKFHPTWDVGVRLTWTPNDALTGSGAVAEAESRAAQTELQKAALRDSIGIEVVEAVQGLQELEFATQTSKRELASAEESYRVRRELFRNGRATSVELTDAELALTRARFNLVTVEANLRFARARFEHVLGRDVPSADTEAAR
jgi:outer membrane protein TolC